MAPFNRLFRWPKQSCLFLALLTLCAWAVRDEPALTSPYASCIRELGGLWKQEGSGDRMIDGETCKGRGMG